MERSFGVDEAGRGPVLGSLFVACVRADPTVLPPEIDDSKRLSPGRRETLAADIHADDRIAVATREGSSRASVPTPPRSPRTSTTRNDSRPAAVRNSPPPSITTIESRLRLARSRRPRSTRQAPT